MMTKEEKIEFRVELVRKGIKIKKWCEDRWLDRVRVSQQLNEHAVLQPDVEREIRKFMEECGEVKNG